MSAVDQIPILPVSHPPVAAEPRARKASWLGPTRTNRWTRWHACMAGFMVCVALVACLDAWSRIYEKATTDEENSHIFLVPIVAACMVWVRRHRIRYCKPSGTALGFIVVIIGWALITFGYYGGTMFSGLAHATHWPFLTFLSLLKSRKSLLFGGAVLLLVGAAMSVLGKHMLLRFLPAVAVLVFLIPVPGAVRRGIAVPLQSSTARIAGKVLTAVGVQVECSGNDLKFPDHTSVTIAEACNGMRMVFALVLIGYAFCFGLPLRNTVRFMILLVSPVAAIFCNLLRILPALWIYHYHGYEAFHSFHTYSGWVTLPISFLMLLAFIRLLRWAMIPVMRYTLPS